MFFAEPTSIHRHPASARGPVTTFVVGALLTLLPTAIAQGSEILAVYDASQPPPNVQVDFELDTQESVAGYVWSFGDGNYSFAAQPTHTYQQEGEFLVSVDVTTTSGTNFTVDAPDLVVIHNQIVADDFDSLIDPLWGAESDQNQEPYGDGMAMGFWMYRGGVGNQQMPNGGIGVSNGAGSGGGGDCIKFDCPLPTDRGLFRFQAEILPMDLMSGTELTLFKLGGAEVEIQLRWSFGVLQARTSFKKTTTAWQSLGATSSGLRSSGHKGRFEVAFFRAGPGMLSDTLDVFWTPDQGTGALSWHSTATGAGPWSSMVIGAFDAVYGSPGGLDPEGLVWIDNFEILRHSLGGVPLQ